MIGDGVNDAPALRLRMLEVQSVRVQMLRWSLPESHVSPKGYTLSQASGRRQHAGNSRKGLFTPFLPERPVHAQHRIFDFPIH